MSSDRDRLRAAYEATDYRVNAGSRGGFVIRVGSPAPTADALLTAAGAGSWAFITACNPRSQPLPEAENLARMKRLEEVVRHRGLVHHSGTGVAADGAWPPEPSLFVIGLDEAAALALAREFDQHAVVVGCSGGPARLAWIDAGPGPG